MLIFLISVLSSIRRSPIQTITTLGENDYLYDTRDRQQYTKNRKVYFVDFLLNKLRYREIFRHQIRLVSFS